MKLQRFLTIAVLLFAGSVFAQSRTVEGTVSYGKAPIKGITIAVQGSAKTTKTDDKGHYKIDLAPSESTLIFTGEGLISQYVKLKEKTDPARRHPRAFRYGPGYSQRSGR